MNILLINQDWFAEEWRAAGHNVKICGLNPGLEVPLDAPFMHIDTLIGMLPDNFKPDRIVFHDNSSPVLFSGLDETPIPCLFYSVDTHHHYDLHRHLYNVFDHTLVAQRDYISYFEQAGQHPEWFPLWASRWVEPSFDDKKYGAVFVGNINAELNPERKTFFDALQKETSILCTQGNYWEIFPFAEVVVNQTVKSDLNFRVFEAMMCGSMLLTEHAGNGLYDIFKSKEQIVTYIKNDVREAAEKIRHFVSHPQEARAIARAGREEILARHLSKHRAEVMLEKVLKLEKKQAADKHFSMMCNFVILAQRLRQKNMQEAGQLQSLVLALRSAELALAMNEPLDNTCALHAVAACVLYDLLAAGGLGRQMLLRLAQTYRDAAPVQLAKVRLLLNEGRVNEARELSREVSPLDPDSAFEKVEELIASLIS